MTITEDQMEEIVDYALGVLPEYPAPVPDWDDLLYRIECVFDLELGDSMSDPDVVAVQKAIRAGRRATAG